LSSLSILSELNCRALACESD